MKIQIYGRELFVVRDKYRDPGYYNGGWSTGESVLLYHICNALNEAWRSVTGVEEAYRKLKMVDDGHLTSDMNYYIRPRGVEVYAPHLYIYNARYAIEDQAEILMNEGKCFFAVDPNVYDVQNSPIFGEMLALLQNRLFAMSEHGEINQVMKGVS